MTYFVFRLRKVFVFQTSMAVHSLSILVICHTLICNFTISVD